LKTNINIFEVAKEAGVSKSTVSRALNNDYGVSQEAKEKVMTAVEVLKYRPNMSAKHLRKKNNNLLGILISREYAEYEDVFHPLNSYKIEGIIKRASELDYDVLIFMENISDPRRLHSVIKEKGIAAIILMDTVPNDVLESFRSYRIPFVQINWLAIDYKHQCYVKTDLSKATTMALNLFVEKGYTDIGVINWEDRHMEEKVIQNAFADFMEKKGLIHKGCILNTEFEVQKDEIYEFLRRTKKRAYLCFSYPASMNIIKYCTENGISMPDELALISYEFFPFFDLLYPKLTGIKQQADLMGEKAVDKLVQKLNGEENVINELLVPEIIIRESC